MRHPVAGPPAADRAECCSVGRSMHRPAATTETAETEAAITVENLCGASVWRHMGNCGYHRFMP